MLIAVSLSDKDFQKNLELSKELGANIIELRLDLFEDKSYQSLDKMLIAIKDIGLKSILTPRGENEELYIKFIDLCDYIDIDIKLTQIISKVRELRKRTEIIVSYHNFEQTPPDWVVKEIHRQAIRFGADIVKLALMSQSYEDTVRFLCLSKTLHGRKILISMGQYGIASRMVGFLFGSEISFAYISEPSAPGQLSLKELSHIRNLMQL
ncbi:MAG: type I 3-dehydroquinate dehydratase [Aquificaceae bacterium]|nr:type I 3-dehydroquinate dehydratase [Aquificaceae bacterium]